MVTLGVNSLVSKSFRNEFRYIVELDSSQMLLSIDYQ